MFRLKRYTTFVAVMIVVAGLASGAFAALTNASQKREYLVGRAQTIADTLPTGDVKNLEGNQNDLSTLAYFRVKQQLEQVRGSNLDIARIRLFTASESTVQIKADALTPDSPGYASPGTEYSEASHALKDSMTRGTPTFDRLTSDYSGRWVAAYAPVFEPETRQIVGSIGVFVPANSYYLEILLYALVPILLAAIPLAGILRDMKIQAKEHEILQLKNQFVSIASHELRSPLTGMLWGITSLQQAEKHLSKGQKDILHDMYKSTESSLATVNEILDQSIFERGQAGSLQHDIVDMTAVVNQVFSTLRLGAQEKNISIERSGEWPEHAYVLGDVGALKRALMNVVANAIKYSPEKSHVAVGFRKSPNKEHILSVSDHGIGIPEDEQSKVLGGYYRASNATNVQANGTGLGLWVTSMVIRQHGGRMWFNSKVGEGTTFFIALPATEVASTEPKV